MVLFPPFEGFTCKIKYVSQSFWKSLEAEKIIIFYFFLIRGYLEYIYSIYIIGHYEYIYYESITNVSYQHYACLLN